MFEQRLITHTRIPVSVRNWIFKQNEQKSPSPGRRNSEVTGMSLCTILISGTNRNGLNVCLHCKLLMATIQFEFEHWKKKSHRQKVAKWQQKMCTEYTSKHMNLENSIWIFAICEMLMTIRTRLILTSLNRIFKNNSKSFVSSVILQQNHLGNLKTTSLNCIWHFVCLLST